MESSEFKKMFKVITQKKKGNDKLMGIAYHETGHVLFDLVYGFPVKKVTITPNKNRHSAGDAQNFWTSEGYDFQDTYEYYTDCIWETEKQIEYLVLSLLGGIIGEAFYTGKYNWEGAESDLNQILDVFCDYQIFDIPDLQKYWNKTFEIIAQNEKVLIQIANDLYKNKTLNSEYFERKNWPELKQSGD